MGKNLDPRIDAYIKDSAAFAGPILRHLREQVHKGCPEVTETIKWSSPFFEHAGRILCFMAAFKAHCAFGFWNRGMRKQLRQYEAKNKAAMGGFGRITSLADLPDDKTLIGFVQQAARLNESGATGRLRPASKGPKREPAAPADLTGALRKNKPAAKTFAAFSPSQRKEYIEWITEAKRDETRQKRLAATLEWLAQASRGFGNT